MPTTNDLIQQLYRRRRQLVDSQRALHADIREGRRQDDAEAQGIWERMDSEIVGLGKRLDELVGIEETNKELASQREQFAPMLRGNGAAPGDDPNKWMREWFMGEGPRHILADLRSVKQTRDEFGRTKIEEHDLSVGTTTAGGFTVPQGFVARLFEHMVAASGVRSAGATVVTADDGRVSLVPKTTTYSTAGIIAEGVAITESDPVFAQASLTTYKYAFITQVSRELIEDTAVDLIGFLSRDAGTAIGIGSGAHFATGSGTGQPLGVGGTTVPPAVGKTGLTGQTTTVIGDDLLDLYHSIVGRYRQVGSWIMLDATLASVRKIKDTTNQYLWQPGLAAGAPDTLLGRPVFTDQGFPAMAANAYSIAFGDFASYYIIRDVRGIQFDRSDDFAFDRDTSTFRALLRTAGTRVLDGASGAVKFYRNSAT